MVEEMESDYAKLKSDRDSWAEEKSDLQAQVTERDTKLTSLQTALQDSLEKMQALLRAADEQKEANAEREEEFVRVSP